MEEFADESFVDAAEQRLFRKIEALEEQKTIRKRSFSLWKRYAAAAVVLLIAGMSIDLLVRGTLPCKDKQIELLTGAEISAIELPDGTKVWLNQYSALKYPSDFGKEVRQVFLDGEAYFEVVPDRMKPFVVESDLLTARVLGTTFNFKSRPQADKIEVSLIEGEVQVKETLGDGQIILSPGQRAELNINNKRLTVQQVDAGLDAVWHNDLIPFSQATISYIANVLEQFYDVKFVLSLELNVSTTYSGVVRRKDTIEDVLISLQHVIPIYYEIAGTNIFLYSVTR
ncbi:MAG: FecR domain-containing protein [Tannerellaceae bacterium]|nr:FecR domain-containing protein [Tannerellaceae bacterium]